MKWLTPAFLTLVMFLVVGGLVALYIGKSLFARDEPVATPKISTLPMSLADIEPGTLITQAHIGLGRIPSDQVEPDMLLSDRVIVNRVAKEKIRAGEAFRPSLLYPPGVRPPLQVEEGYRAVSVTVQNESQMVDGLISPGQFVDVHFTVDTTVMNSQTSGGMTMTLFRGVKVLAMNNDGLTNRGRNTVTLELTPMQANIVIQAVDRGEITLTYNPTGRGQGIVEVPEDDRATLDQILGLQPEPQPEPPFMTEDYSGSSRNANEWEEGRRSQMMNRGMNGELGSDNGTTPRSSTNPSQVPVTSNNGPTA